MKVAIVVNTLKIGGMERVAINLSDAYQKSGHDTHLIYLRDKKIDKMFSFIEVVKYI